MVEFDKRLLPNYIFAGATIGVFLFLCVFALTNADTLISTVSTTDPETALIMGGVGGTLITALLMNVRDVYQFFFRVSPTKT